MFNNKWTPISLSLLTLLFLNATLYATDPAKSAKKPLVVIKEVISSKGIKAWLVEDHSIPVVSMNASFDGGALLDPLGKEGLALLTSAMMTEGAGPYTQETFFDYTADHAIDLGFGATEDYFVVTIRTTRDNLDKSFDLLNTALYETRFPEKELKKAKDGYIVQLDNLEKDPDYIAQQALSKILYKGHPYERSMSGSKTSLQKIKTSDLFSFRKKQFKKNLLTIGVCGDITEQELSQKLDDLFGSLPSEDVLKGIKPVLMPRQGSTHTIINKRPQSTVQFAQPSILSSSPDYIKVMILNKILGEGFSSRLMKRLRVEGGLVYSVGSVPSSRKYVNVLFGSFAADNQNVNKAIRFAREEIQKLRDEGIVSKELDDAKTSLQGGYALRFSNSLAIASIAAAYQQMELPIDYVDQRADRINAVTLDEVNAFAKTFLKPEELTFVTVGEPREESAESSKEAPAKTPSSTQEITKK
jgi:zinc protease